MSEKEGARILVVDDEPEILRTLSTALTHHGFQVKTANNARQALESHAYWHPDIILLDLGLPDMDGLEIIREVRTRGETPIVVLSVRGSEDDKVAALELGADDYLTKPFGTRELLARVQVGLRHAARVSSGGPAAFRTGQLEVDLERRSVKSGGAEVHLTPTEYELLKAFVTHPEKVLTDQTLLRLVWGPGYGGEAHYLHVYMARLRKKLESGPKRPTLPFHRAGRRLPSPDRRVVIASSHPRSAVF